MTYIQANTGRAPIRWYKFNPKDMSERVPFKLVEKLDLNIVPGFRTKTEAKKAAIRLGLQTWRYIRFWGNG